MSTPLPPPPMTVSVASPDKERRMRAEFLHQLVQQVPTLLASQDTKTGRFGAGIWIVTDQNVLFPLAVAWATQDPANPYYHDPKVLEAIGKGGDALIEAQDAKGKWVFRKKDDSTWGDIYMPWTYSRWVRAFGLIRDALPPERRARWEKALTLGYTGIAAEELQRVHNIPTHHAMGLYCAGEALNRPEWKEQAVAFLRKVAGLQDPGGFWSENLGPVVGYNFVYTDALGVYYALSHDAAVLPALEHAARFHAAFTYPNGSSVETVDERQGYTESATMPNVGFSFSPEGRGYIQRQWDTIVRTRKPSADRTVIAADVAASLVQYGAEGPATPPPGGQDKGRFLLGKNDALVQREKPWFVALSAYHAPVPQSRWIEDRQNLVSLYHDKVGLIVGGGNTKLQPLWSTFTVGDTALLFHKPGDEQPDFTPPKGLFHVPEAATLLPDPLTMNLTYGGVPCTVQVITSNSDSASLRYTCAAVPKDGMPVAAHVPLLPHLGKEWKTASGKSGHLSSEPLRLTSEEAGGWFEHAGWHIALPPGSSLVWPVLPHDQYKKDGHADTKQGRLVLALPLTAEHPQAIVTITVPR